MSTHLHLNLTILISPSWSCVELSFSPWRGSQLTVSHPLEWIWKESPLTVFSWPATEKHFQGITSVLLTAVWYLLIRGVPPVHVCSLLILNIRDGELPLSYRVNSRIQRLYISLIKGANKSGSVIRANEGDDEQTTAEDLSAVIACYLQLGRGQAHSDCSLVCCCCCSTSSF